MDGLIYPNRRRTPPMPSDVEAKETGPDAPKSLSEALLAFQTDPPQVIKDSEAEVRSKDGKSKLYDYKYLSLQKLLMELRPRLSQLGLLWRSTPGIEEGKPVLFYSIEHVPSKEKEEGIMPMVAGATMQALGSSFSFARRYALIIVLGLAPDVDEDAAVPHEETQQPARGAAGRKLTKAKAGELFTAAEQAGVANRLQLAASHVIGADVGPVDTKAQAEKALVKLTVDQGMKLAGWIEEKAAKALEA
jgi:ERF superfamily